MKSNHVDRVENFPLRLIGLQINSPLRRAQAVDVAHVRRERNRSISPILFLASIVLPRIFFSPRQSRILFRMNEMRRNAGTDESGKRKKLMKCSSNRVALRRDR